MRIVILSSVEAVSVKKLQSRFRRVLGKFIFLQSCSVLSTSTSLLCRQASGLTTSPFASCHPPLLYAKSRRRSLPNQTKCHARRLPNSSRSPKCYIRQQYLVTFYDTKEPWEFTALTSTVLPPNRANKSQTDAKEAHYLNFSASISGGFVTPRRQRQNLCYYW